MELCDVLYARRAEEQGYGSAIVEDVLISFIFKINFAVGSRVERIETYIMSPLQKRDNNYVDMTRK